MSEYLNIQAYYSLNFNLLLHHNWSITEIEKMYPFERDIYVEMLNAYLEEKKREDEERNGTGPT